MNISEDFIKKKREPTKHQSHKMMKMEKMLIKNTKKEKADESRGRAFQQMEGLLPNLHLQAALTGEMR